MSLRKFGIEDAQIEVDRNDPQGLSRTAMNALAAKEPAEPLESAQEGTEAPPEGE